jgi:hypothetical protein
MEKMSTYYPNLEIKRIEFLKMEKNNENEPLKVACSKN